MDPSAAYTDEEDFIVMIRSFDRANLYDALPHLSHYEVQRVWDKVLEFGLNHNDDSYSVSDDEYYEGSSSSYSDCVCDETIKTYDNVINKEQ
jgi:hypothetical protein